MKVTRIQRPDSVSSNRRGKYTLWLVLFIAFGYPVQAAAPAILHLPSTPINAAFRAVYVLLSLLLIFTSFSFTAKIARPVVGLLLFWFLYSLRLIIDVSLRGISFSDKSTFFVYSMAFGNCLLPMIAIALNAQYIRVRNVYKMLYGMIALSNLLILYIIIQQNGGISLELFIGRMSIMGEDGGDPIINTITIGFYGNLLVILSLYTLMFVKSVRFWVKVLPVLLMLIGLFNLVVAASRGPFLAMILIAIFLLYFKYRLSISKIGFLLKSTAVIIGLGFVVLITTGLSGDDLSENFTMFSRLSSFEENVQSGDKEERNDLYSEAWQQFLSSPVVGDSFVTKTDAFYPHNLYLEVLMSMGLIGISILFLVHVEIFKKVRTLFKEKEILIIPVFLVLLASLLSSMTSGGIPFSMGLWSVLTFFLSSPFDKNDDEAFT